MLENTNIAGIQKGIQAVYKMSADERTKELIRMREKALHDEASLLEEAIETGIAEGRAEGRAEGIEAVIKGMRIAGISEEQIEAARKAMLKEDN